MRITLTLYTFLLATIVYGQSFVPLKNLDSLRHAASNSEGVPKCNALLALAKAYAPINIDTTKLIIDEALSLAKALGADTTFMEISAQMQYHLSRVGENDLALKYLAAAKRLTSKQSMIPNFRNQVYVALHFLHYYSYTRYDSSVYYGLLTVDLASDSIARADRYIIVGAAYNKMGDNITALEYYNKAQAILNALAFFPGEYCYLYNQMGTLYSDEGDLKKAEEFYLKSIALGKRAGGYPQVSPLTNLAIVYDRMGEYDKSLKYLDSAVTLLPSAYDPWRQAINVRNKGKVLTHAGKPREGIETTLQAMEMYERLKEDYTVARMHLQLAEPYRLLGDYKTAEREALIALEWDRLHGYGELVKESYLDLSRTYVASRQHEKAFKYQNLYLEILDSLNSAERRSKFNQLEKSFEFASQERMRQQLQRENEFYLAQAEADRKVRLYLIVGTIILAAAVILTVVAYRRMRSQNGMLNQQNKKIEDQALQLQEAAKAKSRFFANVSHELRTPVTLLNGMLELMKENLPGNGGNKKLDIALVSSRRLQGMLDEVLDLSRIEVGAWKLSRKPRELLPLLNRIVLAFESLVVRKGLTLEYSGDAIAGLVVDIDEDKFEKVINNLIYNAIKFNKNGGWIRISADRTETSVVIQVADSGIGIPENELPFVFDRFYQSASTEKLHSQGIGIGLSLVREFTELHGGQVTVSSIINEGSCFTIDLPVVIKDAVADDTDVILPELPDVNFNSFPRKPHILVVEDNDEMRFYLKEILGDHVVVKETRNGVEALKSLQSEIPDLIISDVMMPEMDGSELLVNLKNSPVFRGIPVVMLTARASEEDVLHGLSLGVDDYIIKPFNAKELKIRIHNLLTNQAIRKEWSQKKAEPDELPMPAGVAEDEIFMTKVRLFVEDNADNSALSIGDLCHHLAVSERQIYRKAATLTGMTPAQLIKEIRMKIAYKLLLERKVAKVTDLAKRVGFENSSYFSRQFEERFGRRPADFL